MRRLVGCWPRPREKMKRVFLKRGSQGGQGQLVFSPGRFQNDRNEFSEVQIARGSSGGVLKSMVMCWSFKGCPAIEV